MKTNEKIDSAYDEFVSKKAMKIGAIIGAMFGFIMFFTKFWVGGFFVGYHVEGIVGRLFILTIIMLVFAVIMVISVGFISMMFPAKANSPAKISIAISSLKRKEASLKKEVSELKYESIRKGKELEELQTTIANAKLLLQTAEQVK